MNVCTTQSCISSLELLSSADPGLDSAARIALRDIENTTEETANKISLDFLLQLFVLY